MSYPAREVLRCIDVVDVVRERHPLLYAIGRRDNWTCRRLDRAWEKHKTTREPASGINRDHDEVERVDPAWEQRHADELREHSDARKLRFATDRRSRRAGMPLADLLRVAIRALAAEQAISTVPAGSVEVSRGGGTSVGPGHQQTFDDDPRYRFAKQQLRHWTEQVLGLQEEARGLGPVAGAVMMLGSEKDKEILKLEGPTPREVVALLGPQVAGSPRTVERVRTEAYRCRWCGQKQPSSAGTGR